MNSPKAINWLRQLKTFSSDEGASSAVEYAILVALIASTLTPFLQVMSQRINKISVAIFEADDGAPPLIDPNNGVDSSNMPHIIAPPSNGIGMENAVEDPSHQ